MHILSSFHTFFRTEACTQHAWFYLLVLATRCRNKPLNAPLARGLHACLVFQLSCFVLVCDCWRDLHATLCFITFFSIAFGMLSVGWDRSIVLSSCLFQFHFDASPMAIKFMFSSLEICALPQFSFFLLMIWLLSLWCFPQCPPEMTCLSFFWMKILESYFFSCLAFSPERKQKKIFFFHNYLWKNNFLSHI